MHVKSIPYAENHNQAIHHGAWGTSERAGKELASSTFRCRKTHQFDNLMMSGFTSIIRAILDAVIEAGKQAARDQIQEKRKGRVLLALEKKKAQQELLKQLADIELASKRKAVVESIKIGNKAIKVILSEINLEDVHKLMDDTEEAKAYQDHPASMATQISIIGKRLSAEGEEDVLVEFKNLESEIILQSLPAVPASPVSSAAE